MRKIDIMVTYWTKKKICLIFAYYKIKIKIVIDIPFVDELITHQMFNYHTSCIKLKYMHVGPLLMDLNTIWLA